MKITEIVGIVTICSAVAAAIIYFTPLKMFEARAVQIDKKIENIEVAVNKINTAKLKKMLRELVAKYGHDKCYLMQPNDRQTCEWIKESLDQFG